MRTEQPGTEADTRLCPRLGAAGTALPCRQQEGDWGGPAGQGAAHGVREPQPLPGLTTPTGNTPCSPVPLKVTTSWGWGPYRSTGKGPRASSPACQSAGRTRRTTHSLQLSSAAHFRAGLCGGNDERCRWLQENICRAGGDRTWGTVRSRSPMDSQHRSGTGGSPALGHAGLRKSSGPGD